MEEELNSNKKIAKVLNKIGVKSPTEILDIDQIDKLVENLTKLPKESLEQFLGMIPNFKELTKQYMDNLNMSYNKVVNDLIEEKKQLYAMLDKETLSEKDRTFIFEEIREIRRTILLRDTMYNVMNNKAFQVGATIVTVVASAAIGSKLKK
jgi:hypothetical protein